MSADDEAAIGQAILDVVAGHDAHDTHIALSRAIGLLVGGTAFFEGMPLAAAETTLDACFEIARKHMRASWGKVEEIKPQ